ncbi:MAG TPA: Holliday junction branch migration protein RuvA [Candidatus Entotheonella sp.]
MIAHLQGVLAVKTMEQVVVDVHGVGYQVSIPLSTYYALPNLQESVRLLTILHVREDAMRLYGFATEDERALFELLVGVSSIGPRLALNMLSSIAAVELQHAISHSDVARLQTIPGIGRKTAERVMLELHEKVSLVQVAARGPVASVAGSDADHLVGDVVSALLNLGYKRGEAEKAVHRVKADTNGTLAVEEWLREALQQLAR